jgi:translocation and assembly module TamB
LEQKKIDIAGQMQVTEKNISYKAKAKMNKTSGESSGVIDFDKGFDIKYKSDVLDLKEIGPIAELVFLGEGTAEGSTQGDSRSAVFDIDLKMKDLEFQDYYFGDLSTLLKYKKGSLYFTQLQGNLESTRFNGGLEVNLLKENIKGDIQLPFFRMADIQQSILKKVDLKDRFLGSGSGRLQLDTPFEISQLNFNLDARLFKGQAFGEDYNEAKIKAQAIDGIIIIQEGVLQKEETQMLMKGTIDTDLESRLSFSITNGFLQLSSILKENSIPLSGEFTAQGKIFGNLNSPLIKTSAEIKNLIFNKKKYGDALFSYDTTNKQTNLQFNLPNQLELLVLLPESNFDSIFVDLTANDFDLAPLLGFSVSEEATRSYVIRTSGELSGTFNTQSLWDSEFSSTIKDVAFEYKANRMKTTIPTNIELKNGQLFLNEISFVGDRQFIKVTQPTTNPYETKFVINAEMNIAFFKIFVPFIEKIDGSSNFRLELNLKRDKMNLIGTSIAQKTFLKFPGFPHPFENLFIDLLFNQNTVRINSITGEMAGGQVLGSGEVRFGGEKNLELSINTNVDNATINFPEGYRTTGSGQIRLTGSETPFKLSGEWNIYEGLIESNFSSSEASQSSDLLEQLLKKEVSSPLSLDLKIDTKKPVEVRNSLVEGYMFGNMRVFDKITSPRIEGEARFDVNSIIRFNDQEFQVTSSRFTFEGQSPINPQLGLRAQTRLNGYDIELFLQGRASKPVLTWSSQPPLPEIQIVSMLALGTIPDQFNQASAASDVNAQGTQGFEVGTSLLGNNPLGKELKDKYDVDVEFSSSFDDENNAAVPRVTLRHRVTRDFQVSVSATSGNTNQQEGRATYLLTDDLSAIFSITNAPETLDSNTVIQEQQTNRFGIDIEYRREFD